MVSHPGLGSDRPIGSDREPGRDMVLIRSDLLDDYPRQFFEKSSLKFFSQTFFVFLSISCHALMPNILGCPSAYGMHYANPKTFMLIYSHAYILT